MHRLVLAVLLSILPLACGGGDDPDPGTGGSGGAGGSGGGGGDGTGGTGGAGGDPVACEDLSVDPGFWGGSIVRDDRCDSITFGAHGGDYAGSWRVAYGCGDFTFYVGQLFGMSQGGEPMSCSFLDPEIDTQVEGTVAYDGLLETIDLRWRTRYRYTVEDECLLDLMPSDARDVCREIAQRGAPGVTGACAYSGGSCVCDYTVYGAEEGTRHLVDTGNGHLRAAGCEASGFGFQVEADGTLVQRRFGQFLYLVR